ncbi:MAG: hypothetical protein NVSMB64_06030 [Candidatus Velthaea sp.]
MALWSTLAHGVPAFRHDWRVPLSSDAVVPFLQLLTSGWQLSGIGATQPYPTAYLPAFILMPVAWAGGALPVLMFVVGGGAALAAGAAYRIATRFGAPQIAALAIAAFAALNPWTYSKLVAGHIFMVFALGVWLAVAAESIAERPNRFRLSLLALFIPLQIEFFAIGIVPLVIWCLSKRYYGVIAFAAMGIAPIAIGFAAEYGTIRTTPYLLAWQIGQSVDPGSVASPRGYGGMSDRADERVEIGRSALAISAAAGLVAGRRTRWEIAIVSAAALALLVTTGTKGGIAAPYAWVVQHVPESGLFRELYDVVAVGIAIYIIGLARLTQRVRWASVGVTAAVLISIVPWAIAPVFSQTLPARAFPLSDTPHDVRFRVAFDPEFQPLQLAGKGSGVDPDAVWRDRRELPFNEAAPVYPIDVALARFERSGDTRMLGDLGVNAIIRRSELHSNVKALKDQIGDVRDFHARRSERVPDALALLTWASGEPRPARIADDFRLPAIFYADREAEAAIVKLYPQTGAIDPRTSWIDARIAFPAHPEWGNAFGGVATTGIAPLDVHGIAALLASVHGTLVGSAGEIVAHSTRGFEWIVLKSGTTSIACRGACALATGGNPPRSLPDQGPATALRPLAADMRTPWLLEAANVEPGFLRLAIRYDRAWIAISGTHVLQHQRLNSTLNGWTLDRPAARIWFINLLAAAQFALEMLVCAILAGLCLAQIPVVRARVAGQENRSVGVNHEGL